MPDVCRSYLPLLYRDTNEGSPERESAGDASPRGPIGNLLMYDHSSEDLSVGSTHYFLPESRCDSARTPRVFFPACRAGYPGSVWGCVGTIVAVAVCLVLVASNATAQQGLRSAPYPAIVNGEVGLSAHEGPRFRVVTKGNCAGSGMVPIVKQATCEIAAEILGLADNTAMRTADIERPEGCYLGKGTVLWMGTNPLSKGKGAETTTPGVIRQPICMSRTELANMRQAPRYWKITTGTCGNVSMQPIVEEAVCEEAASYLKLKDRSVGTTNDLERPEGCYYGNGRVLWMGVNPHSKGKGAETSSGATTRHPICMRRADPGPDLDDLDRAPVEAADQARVFLEAAPSQQPDGKDCASPCKAGFPRGMAKPSTKYQKIEMGTCSSQGMATITDKASCEAAANELGLGDEGPQETSAEGHPEGCFLDADEAVRVATNPANKGKGVMISSNGNTQHPICRALKDEDSEDRYMLVTTGNCASNNMLPIRIDTLCEAAASELGLAQHDPRRTKLLDRPEGCYFATPAGPDGNRLFLDLEESNTGKGAETSTGDMDRQPLCVSRAQLIAHVVLKEHETHPLEEDIDAQATLQEQLHAYAGWQGSVSCHTSVEGESCYGKAQSAAKAVQDALPTAHIDEVQATLHRLGHADCPRPCMDGEMPVSESAAHLFQAVAKSIGNAVAKGLGVGAARARGGATETSKSVATTAAATTSSTPTTPTTAPPTTLEETATTPTTTTATTETPEPEEALEGTEDDDDSDEAAGSKEDADGREKEDTDDESDADDDEEASEPSPCRLAGTSAMCYHKLMWAMGQGYMSKSKYVEILTSGNYGCPESCKASEFAELPEFAEAKKRMLEAEEAADTSKVKTRRGLSAGAGGTAEAPFKFKPAQLMAAGGGDSAAAVDFIVKAAEDSGSAEDNLEDLDKVLEEAEAFLNEDVDEEASSGDDRPEKGDPLAQLVPGEKYSLSMSGRSTPKTKRGCTCMQDWILKGFGRCATAANGFCCNPSGDASGPWCFTEGHCHGRSWDACTPGPIDRWTISDGSGRAVAVAAPVLGFTQSDPFDDVERGEELPLSVAAPEGGAGASAPATKAGCLCRDNWRVESSDDGIKAHCASEENGWCCNPDGDSGGDWCYTQDDCEGRFWDRCTPVGKSENKATFLLFPA